MAEIDVERRRSSAWTWIIGLVLITLLIWVLAEARGGGEPAAEETRMEEVNLDGVSVPPLSAGLRIT